MADLEAFKEEVRAIIAEHLPEELRVGNRPDLPKESLGRWISVMADHGWITPDWPTEYGGGGLDRKHAAALKAELKKVRAPVVSSFGVSMLGPTLLEYGTEEQKQEFLPKIRNTMRWCQGFSEPGSGSTCGLQCRAEKDEDEYVITGQKIWTTGADRATGSSAWSAPTSKRPSTRASTSSSSRCTGTGSRSRRSPDRRLRALLAGLLRWSPGQGGTRRRPAQRRMDRGQAAAPARAEHGRVDGGIGGAAKESISDFVKREVGMEGGVLADAIRERLAAHEIDKRALSLTCGGPRRRRARVRRAATSAPSANSAGRTW